MIRSQDEIKRRFDERAKSDHFGFEVNEYAASMDYEHVKPLLHDGVIAAYEAGEKVWQPTTAANIDEEAKDYLAFFLEKIGDERGLSVLRATAHYIAWKWLLGHPDSDTFPGSINGGSGGYYQQDAYDYLKAQIDSGEWDRLTQDAMKAVTDNAG